MRARQNILCSIDGEMDVHFGCNTTLITSNELEAVSREPLKWGNGWFVSYTKLEMSFIEF